MANDHLHPIFRDLCNAFVPGPHVVSKAAPSPERACECKAYAYPHKYDSRCALRVWENGPRMPQSHLPTEPEDA